MRAIILGAGAGGGFPQWNCGCASCVAVREGTSGLVPRTQDAVAVTSDDASFVLVNASPDVLEQIKRTRALWPKAPRHSPIGAIVLTNGDMDHVLGLFSLRESQPLTLYVTSSVRRGLEANAFLRTLQRFEGQLVFRDLPVTGAEIPLADATGTSLGLTVRAFPAPGKLPVHFVGHAEPSPDDNVGLVFRDVRSGGDGASTLAYVTACADAASLLDAGYLTEHGALLFDGTFYREDELVRMGLSKSHAKDMAHVPIDGERGSLRALASLVGTRRIYTHVNNTNPILGTTPERATVEAAGWEIAYDGMEIRL